MTRLITHGKHHEPDDAKRDDEQVDGAEARQAVAADEQAQTGQTASAAPVLRGDMESLWRNV